MAVSFLNVDYTTLHSGFCFFLRSALGLNTVLRRLGLFFSLGCIFDPLFFFPFWCFVVTLFRCRLVVNPPWHIFFCICRFISSFLEKLLSYYLCTVPSFSIILTFLGLLKRVCQTFSYCSPCLLISCVFYLLVFLGCIVSKFHSYLV